MARELFLKYDQQAMIGRYDLPHDENYLYLVFLGDLCRISRSSGHIERLRAAACPRADGAVAQAAEGQGTSAGKQVAEEHSASAGKQAAEEHSASVEKQTAAGLCTSTRKETAAGETVLVQERIWEPCVDFNAVMTIYDALCYPKERPALAGEWCPLANLQVAGSPNADIFNAKYAEAFSGHTDRLRQACEALGGRPPQISAGADICWEFDVFPFFQLQLRFWEKDEEFPAKLQLLWDRNSLQFMHFETLYYLMGVLLEKLRKLSGEAYEDGRLPDIRLKENDSFQI